DAYWNGWKVGTRVWRCDSTGAIVPLGSLNAPYEASFCEIGAVNAAGTAVGRDSKYIDGERRGERAVRWTAGSTNPIELETLLLDNNGWGSSIPHSINSHGDSVGVAFTV